MLLFEARMAYKINSNQAITDKIKLLWGFVPGKFHKLTPGPLREQNRVLNEAEHAGFAIAYHSDGHLLSKENRNYFLRKNSSDYLVFQQVILGKEYQPLIDIAKKTFKDKALTLVDAGANVGFATLALAAELNLNKVICIEPDSSNFKNLETNLKSNQLNQAKLLKTGLWNKETRLKVSTNFRDGREWSLSLEETSADDKQGFDCVSLESLFKNYQLERIDILKIDIEGGEKTVFEGLQNQPELLYKIGIIAVEIHDEIADRALINTQLKAAGFSLETIGETTLAINQNLEL